MEIDDDGSDNEITSNSEDDYQKNQKVTLNETILILVVLLLLQNQKGKTNLTRYTSLTALCPGLPR